MIKDHQPRGRFEERILGCSCCEKGKLRIQLQLQRENIFGGVKTELQSSRVKYSGMPSKAIRRLLRSIIGYAGQHLLLLNIGLGLVGPPKRKVARWSTSLLPRQGGGFRGAYKNLHSLECFDNSDRWTCIDFSFVFLFYFPFPFSFLILFSSLSISSEKEDSWKVCNRLDEYE